MAGNTAGNKDGELPTKCPICKRKVAAPPRGATREQMGHYPFCSDRCKLVDLGRWLSGAYQIPVKDTDDDEEREGPVGGV